LRAATSRQQQAANLLDVPGETKDGEQDGHHQHRPAETEIKPIGISVDEEREDRACEDKAQSAGEENDVCNELLLWQFERRIVPQALPVRELDKGNCDYQDDFILARYNLAKLRQLPENRNAVP
jgi:hypothetical protein